MFGIALLAATLVLVFRVEDRENRAVGYVVVVLILLFVFSYAYTFMWGLVHLCVCMWCQILYSHNYNYCMYASYRSVPWIVNSEMHPLRIRGIVCKYILESGAFIASHAPRLSARRKVCGKLHILFFVRKACVLGEAIGLVNTVRCSKVLTCPWMTDWLPQWDILSTSALAGSITTVVYWLGNTLVAQLSPVLLASPQIRTQGTLYILAGVNITAFLFVLLVLPETKVYNGLCACVFISSKIYTLLLQF